METKTFEVEMRIFQKGAIKKVSVPSQDIGTYVEDNLRTIYHYGQNDIQQVEGFCSLSMGDVIRYENDRYLVLSIGFRKLEEGELTNTLESPENVVAEIFRMFNEEKGW